jgi:hypothetical protein
MARLQSMMADLQFCTAGIAPDKIQPALVAFARSELAKTIADGTGSPNYDLYVNNAPATTEENVVLPGPINYVFRWWGDIVTFALQTLLDLSPEASGDYKKSWIVRVDGEQVTDYTNIDSGAVVEIVNDSDYARSITVGHKHYRIGHQNIEEARSAVNGVYGNFIDARSTMIQLPDGYILKGHFVKGFRQFARRKLRPDVRRGESMTYPCLQLSVKGM